MRVFLDTIYIKLELSTAIFLKVLYIQLHILWRHT
jgi:hypothetical protein